MQQFRNSSDPNAPMYSPHRDIAYIYGPFLTEVFKGLDVNDLPEYFKTQLLELNLDNTDMAKAIDCFANAHIKFIRDLNIKTPFDAYEESGFSDAHPLIQIMLFYKLGMVAAGGFFVSYRDVTLQGEEDHPAVGVKEMVAAGLQLAAQLEGKEVSNLTETSEFYKLQADVLKLNRLVDEQSNLLEEARQSLAQSKNTVKQLLVGENENKATIYQDASIIDGLTKQLESLAALRKFIKITKTSSIMSRIIRCIQLAWTIFRKKKVS